jgi:hypothetical protein
MAECLRAFYVLDPSFVDVTDSCLDSIIAEGGESAPMAIAVKNARELLREYDSGASGQGWQLLNDPAHMTPCDDPCLVFRPCGYYGQTFYYATIKVCSADKIMFGATHWMPLPAAPSDEEAT